MQTYTLPKVDALGHIHDHGLAVEFSDKRHIAVMASLQAPSTGAQHRVNAGQSHITVQTVGNVTLTTLYSAVGSYTSRRLHYYNAETKEKTRFDEGENSLAFEMLLHVIFGQTLPSAFAQSCTTGSGERADEMRKWAKSWAWSFAGESGLRAWGQKQQRKNIQDTRTSAESRVSYARSALIKLQRENVRKAETLASAKAQCKDALESVRTKDKNIRESLATLRARLVHAMANPDCEDMVHVAKVPYYYTYAASKAPSPLAVAFEESPCRTFSSIARTGEGSTLEAPASTNGDVGSLKPYTKQDPHLTGSSATWNKQHIAANYTATVQGDKLTLSSGIVCPFSVATLKSWLQGKGSAPHTSYGMVSKVETHNNDASNPQPVLLFKCGCHYVNLATCGDAELEMLCTPTHTVECHGATPSFTLGVDSNEAFLAEFDKRCAQAFGELDKHNAETNSETVAQYRTTKARLLSMDKSIADAETNIADMENEQRTINATCDAQLAAITGASVDTLNTSMIAFAKSMHTFGL